MLDRVSVRAMARVLPVRVSVRARAVRYRAPYLEQPDQPAAPMAVAALSLRPLPLDVPVRRCRLEAWDVAGRGE